MLDINHAHACSFFTMVMLWQILLEKCIVEDWQRKCYIAFFSKWSLHYILYFILHCPKWSLYFFTNNYFLVRHAWFLLSCLLGKFILSLYVCLSKLLIRGVMYRFCYFLMDLHLPFQVNNVTELSHLQLSRLCIGWVLLGHFS